jgi:hypothetical protein
MREAALGALVSIVAVVAAAPAAAADPAIPKQEATALLDAWVKAQNDGDFAAYGALYDASFVGIKRTSGGGQKRYTLATWKADRKKMFKGTQKVAAEGARVTVDHARATIAFTQRYQSGKYADHGNKQLVVVEKGGKLTIAREEMLYSAPGWNADPKMELDATALSSPITATVLQDREDPAATSGCGTVTYTLQLADGKHREVSADVGIAIVALDDLKDEIPIDPKADALFELGYPACAGDDDIYKIVKNGDALVVRHKEEDEAPDDVTDYTPPDWETRLTVRLPAGATIK